MDADLVAVPMSSVTMIASEDCRIVGRWVVVVGGCGFYDTVGTEGDTYSISTVT